MKPSKSRIKGGAKKAKGQMRNGKKKTRNIKERVSVIQVEFIGCERVL